MRKQQHANRLARRTFLLGSAATLAGLPELAKAQGQTQSQAPDARQVSPIRAEPLSPRIAEFVTGFDLKQAPAGAIQQARTAFIDTIGVTLAGSTEKSAEIVRDMVKEEGAAPAVSVIGSALKTSPQLAALANGVASHALDFDFTFQQGQMMAPVIPALLPLAEKLGATQSEVLAAFMVGFEVCSRISRANPTQAGEGAWHATSTIGAISAAVACARLMKLPASKIPDVIGIAVSLASGVNANYGTMTKPLHAGHAAKNGMMAAVLGGKGFTSNHAALEGRGGFFATFGRGMAISTEPFNDLGKQFDLVEIGYRPKRYPCGGVIHTGIDAALMIRDELGPRVADIASIKAGISKYAASRAKPEYPADMEAAKFNLQYVIGYSLVHGAPHLASFEPDAIKNEQTKAMAQKVAVALDPEFDNAHEDYPTRVAVTLKDGRTIEKLVVYASGTPKNPMSAAQLRDKFFDCAEHAKVARGSAEKIAAILDKLGDQDSLGELWPLLRKA
jgi:2-methylcitrate dehydratase PrpD